MLDHVTENVLAGAPVLIQRVTLAPKVLGRR